MRVTEVHEWFESGRNGAPQQKNSITRLFRYIYFALPTKRDTLSAHQTRENDFKPLGGEEW